MKQILTTVYDALRERATIHPPDRRMHPLERSTYITTHSNARSLIRQAGPR